MNLQRCRRRERLGLATASFEDRSEVIRPSVPSVSCAGGGGRWSFSANSVTKLCSACHACVLTVRVGRAVSSCAARDSCGAGIPAADEVSCSGWGGGACQFRYMPMSRAGAWKRVSAGPADFQWPITISCLCCLCLQQATTSSMT
jgi:hypothetical protein